MGVGVQKTIGVWLDWRGELLLRVQAVVALLMRGWSVRLKIA